MSSRLAHLYVVSHWNLCLFRYAAFHLWKRHPVLVTQNPLSLSSLLHWSPSVARLHQVSETRHGPMEARRLADPHRVPQRSRQPREWSPAQPTPPHRTAAATGRTRPRVSARWLHITLSIEFLFLLSWAASKWDWILLMLLTFWHIFNPVNLNCKWLAKNVSCLYSIRKRVWSGQTLRRVGSREEESLYTTVNLQCEFPLLLTHFSVTFLMRTQCTMCSTLNIRYMCDRHAVWYEPCSVKQTLLRLMSMSVGWQEVTRKLHEGNEEGITGNDPLSFVQLGQQCFDFIIC